MYNTSLNLMLKFILSIVMIYVSFGPRDIKEILKMLIFFYLTSFTFGGASLGVIYMVNTGKISIQNGIIIGNYTLKTILVGFVVAFVIVIIAFKFVKSKIKFQQPF